MSIVKVENHDMEIKEFKGNRVVTLKDVDCLHNRDEGTAGRNFQNNKKYLLENVDFYLLKRGDQSEFPYVKIPNRGLIALTQSGYSMLVKSLNDDIAWSVQREMVNGYFNKASVIEVKPQITSPSSIEDLIIMQAQSVKDLKNEVALLKAQQKEDSEKLNEFVENITAVPDSTIVNKVINEIQRWTRLDHNDVYKKIYETMKQRHGKDVPKRVENERKRIQDEHHEKTGRWYAESTLKTKVNGIDVMVRMGCLHEFYEIAAAWLSKEKSKSKLRLVQ